MNKHVIVGLAASLLFATALHAQTETCSVGQPACEIASGTYRVVVPDTPPPDDGYPALIFFHGAGGSGEQSLKNTSMVDTFVHRGYAVIGPDGMKRPTGRFGSGWSFRPGQPAQRDEMAFSRAVLDDASARFGLNRDKIIMGGFSIGGSLTWYLACQDPTVADAFAPVAGAFWRPHPVTADCKGPVRMLHTHGWRDETVPLEGRPLRSGAIIQGDVFYGLQVMRELNSCSQMRADDYQTGPDYWIRWWTRCEPGTALRFAMHPGGHSVPLGWADMVMDWYEGLETMSGHF